ncbi:GYF domain-containing protein [Flavobacterium frigidarium]|uniref:GYF domain-containing protein n=1 Tax=Flavobacterium frigidarium TaxID=99286 RepID=UPI0004269DFA|nr:DUF4339 domain-containing protein [Flavobacterium frigidarium]
MKTYYINNGGENAGPFTIEQLQFQLVLKETLVWSNGMVAWKPAATFPELQQLFYKTADESTEKKSAYTEDVATTKSATILGLKKSYFYLGVLLTFVFIGIGILKYIQQSKQAILDERNKETQFGNAQVEIQQKEANQDRIQQEIEKRIQSQNNAKYRKDTITARIEEVKNLLVQNKQDLVYLKEEKQNAENFKLLRSEEGKQEQIDAAQVEIENKIRTVDALDNELNRLYLELETIH